MANHAADNGHDQATALRALDLVSGNETQMHQECKTWSTGSAEFSVIRRLEKTFTLQALSNSLGARSAT